MPQDIDATTGQVIPDTAPVQPVRIMQPGTTASIINIPPQIATTMCWVALGFGICWWMMNSKKS